MKYDYENLSDGQFEQLVVSICFYLFGAGVQGFATGKDGGRDAKFVGTATHIPSGAAPWVGTAIIQAKHTQGFNKKFSDSDFYSESSASAVINKELPRITALRKANGLDHYMLFSNRRLTAISESKIRAAISKECGIPESSIMLCGVEQIEMWLKAFPQAAVLAEISPIDSPLLVSPEEIADVVEALTDTFASASAAVGESLERVSYAEKNELNGMSDAFSKELLKKYLKHTKMIEDFLADPSNEDLLNKYQAAVEELQLNVIAKRKAHQSFDDIFVYLLRLLCDRDPTLRANKKLTAIVLFYMYWSCDLGITEEGNAEAL